jgi:hypothetical protein
MMVALATVQLQWIAGRARQENLVVQRASPQEQYGVTLIGS